VVAKAEVMSGGDNPRFIVTNLPQAGFRGEDRERFGAARLYEDFYCARGNMENQLKQQVLDLQADRMSTHYLASNQLRLWFATLAYLLLDRMRTLGLRGTALAQATAGTIRTRVLKVAAQVRVSVRRVYVQMSSAFVGQELFRLCGSRRRSRSPLGGRKPKWRAPQRAGERCCQKPPKSAGFEAGKAPPAGELLQFPKIEGPDDLRKNRAHRFGPFPVGV
jgi:hypothetical protein